MAEFEFDAATRLVPLSAEALSSGALPSQALPSQALPSQALPSQALPSQALPSQALPSQALPEGCGFSIDISDQWSGLASVNGGFLLSLCLKALDALLPFPDPIVVSGFYLRPGN